MNKNLQIDNKRITKNKKKSKKMRQKKMKELAKYVRESNNQRIL